MSLLGGKDYPAFNGRSFSNSIQTLIKSVDNRRVMLCFENLVQASNDGMYAEGLLCGSVVSASHCNGFEGAGFSMFMEHLLFDISGQKANFVVGTSGIYILSKLIVPYLSPPNLSLNILEEFLPYFESQKVLLGNMIRTPNATMIDFKCCSLDEKSEISGESKDYKNRIDLKVMRKIIRRVPASSMLHIVYVQLLQDTYFGSSLSETYQDFKEKSKVIVRDDLAFVKLEVRKINQINQVSLQEISHLPVLGSSTKCVVLFIEISKFS